jgi:hypothetical protein
MENGELTLQFHSEEVKMGEDESLQKQVVRVIKRINNWEWILILSANGHKEVIRCTI